MSISQYIAGIGARLAGLFPDLSKPTVSPHPVHLARHSLQVGFGV